MNAPVLGEIEMRMGTGVVAGASDRLLELHAEKKAKASDKLGPASTGDKYKRI